MKKIQLNMKASPFSEAVRMATGELEFKFTNDGMFKLVLQDDETVLRGLISALLNIPESEIESLKVQNPIIMGEGIKEKMFVLDIKVLLNSQMVINLEMQVANHNNWQNRSLSYLCREFDSLQCGEDYASAVPVIQIGILDFGLPVDKDEFYARHGVTNLKTGEVFNSNLKLNVLYLNQIDKATDEDKVWKIDEWARLFKATTWEGLRMIAEKNDVMVSAVETMYKKQTDANMREILRRREDEINHQRRMMRIQEELKEEIERRKQDAINHEKRMQKELAEKEDEIENLKAEIERLKIAEGVRNIIERALRKGNTAEEVARFNDIPLEDVLKVQKNMMQDA